MMRYSRAGVYVPRKKNSKKTSVKDEKKVDWINIFLFLLLAIVILLFVIT